MTDPSIKTGQDLLFYFTNLARRFMFREFDVTILAHDDEAEAVLDFSRKSKAGFLAVLKNSSEGMFRVFSNHFSDRVVKETGGPIFTYNLL